VGEDRVVRTTFCNIAAVKKPIKQEIAQKEIENISTCSSEAKGTITSIGQAEYNE